MTASFITIRHVLLPLSGGARALRVLIRCEALRAVGLRRCGEQDATNPYAVSVTVEHCPRRGDSRQEWGVAMSTGGSLHNRLRRVSGRTT